MTVKQIRKGAYMELKRFMDIAHEGRTCLEGNKHITEYSTAGAVLRLIKYNNGLYGVEVTT